MMSGTAEYWESIPGCYLVGDLAIKGTDGNIMVIGRSDDLIVVAGHNIGTAEVESALVSHKAVAEAAVIGKPDPLKGNTIKAFVTLRVGHTPSEKLKNELIYHVPDHAGPHRHALGDRVHGDPPQDPQRQDCPACAQGKRDGDGSRGRLNARRISDGSKPNFLNTVLWHL